MGVGVVVVGGEGPLKPEIDDGLGSPCTSARVQILPIPSVLVHVCVRGVSDVCILSVPYFGGC